MQNEIVEYHQYTLDEWLTIKEDLHRRLEELSRNFVGIGYRLRQIRDSQMYDGHEDVFSFAQAEYGLSKSTVSRFIAINERFSENGNSLELKEEFRQISSSKLSEMLSLSDEECQLITEQTTVSDIRKYKEFKAEEKAQPITGVIEGHNKGFVDEPKAAGPEIDLQVDKLDPFQQCVFHYFAAEDKQDMLNTLMKLPEDATAKEICNIVNPSGCSNYRHGIVFIFFYDENAGIKFKTMLNASIQVKSWQQFLTLVHELYMPANMYDNVWEMCYKVPEIIPETDEIDDTASEILEKAADEIIENGLNTITEEDSTDTERQEISEIQPSESEENPINTKSVAVATSQQKDEIKAEIASKIKTLDILYQSENWAELCNVAEALISKAEVLANEC